MASDFKLDAIGQIHISVEDFPAAVEFGCTSGHPNLPTSVRLP